jgi:hypothetical protein
MSEQYHNDLLDPDCLKCMRKKLRATALAVFFRDGAGWRIGSFQGDKPASSAEVEFYAMLQSGVPEIIYASADGLFINDDRALREHFPSLIPLLSGSSVIAAVVKRQQLEGVRIAWRDNSDPFEAKDLDTIRCDGNCPDGCI